MNDYRYRWEPKPHPLATTSNHVAPSDVDRWPTTAALLAAIDARDALETTYGLEIPHEDLRLPLYRVVDTLEHYARQAQSVAAFAILSAQFEG